MDFNTIRAEWAKDPHQYPYDTTKYRISERFPDFYVDDEGRYYTRFRDALDMGTYMEPARNPDRSVRDVG